MTKLPIGRADVKADWAAEGAPFAVHWITHVCPKPWRVADHAEEMESHCDADVYAYWQRVWNRLDRLVEGRVVGRRRSARARPRAPQDAPPDGRLGRAVNGRPAAITQSMPTSATELWNSVGRQLRQVMHRRELRRRQYEYDRPWSEGTWAWIAIIGTLALGLAAGALLHKLFIKTPVEVGKGMTVVQAKRMGFQALGEGRGPVGVVSAVDDDDDEDDEDEDEPPPKGKE